MSNLTYHIQRISKFRAELMGIATIWVLVFHYGCPLPVLAHVAKVGYGGVDIFMFLSGFGLFFSLSKQEQTDGLREGSDYIKFYFRRFIRILPIYFVVVLIFQLLEGNYNFATFIFKVTGLGFILQSTPLANCFDFQYYDWYVPTILILYLFFPLIYKFVKKQPIVTLLATFTLSLFLICLLNIAFRDFDKMYMLGISRLTVFVLGTITGWYFHKHLNCRCLNKFGRVLVLIAMATLLVEIIVLAFCSITILWNWCVYWLPFIVIAPGLCIAFSAIFERIKTSLPIVSRFFAFIGSISLEIYLIHIGFINIWKQQLFQNLIGNSVLNFLVGFTLFFTVTLGLSFAISTAIKRVMKYIKKG